MGTASSDAVPACLFQTPGLRGGNVAARAGVSTVHPQAPRGKARPGGSAAAAGWAGGIAAPPQERLSVAAHWQRGTASAGAARLGEAGGPWGSAGAGRGSISPDPHTAARFKNRVGGDCPGPLCVLCACVRWGCCSSRLCLIGCSGGVGPPLAGDLAPLQPPGSGSASPRARG